MWRPARTIGLVVTKRTLIVIYSILSTVIWLHVKAACRYSSGEKFTAVQTDALAHADQSASGAFFRIYFCYRRVAVIFYFQFNCVAGITDNDISIDRSRVLQGIGQRFLHNAVS